MKNLLMIQALCLLCFGCSSGKSCSSSGVQTQHDSADWELTTKVKTSIMSDTSISASARFVSVNTTNGVVTLTGTVPSKKDMDRIVKLAKNVDGVKRVDNQMTVSK